MLRLKFYKLEWVEFSQGSFLGKEGKINSVGKALKVSLEIIKTLRCHDSPRDCVVTLENESRK